jgi:post-segregation antitoxin (ccd killing protein)
MSAARKRKAPGEYEFGLSDHVPEAVQTVTREDAAKAWQARSDAAAAAVTVPKTPYRIFGDPEAGAWFIEEAQVVRSPMPSLAFDHRYMLWSYGMLLDGRGRERAFDWSSYISNLNADEPTAKLEWNRIGRRRKGFRTYAKAARWLQEHLEPITEAPVYFTPDGCEYVY